MILYCLSFQNISSPSLKTVIRKNPKGLPLSFIQRYSNDLLRGLAALEKYGLIHGDIKPENILLEQYVSANIALLLFDKLSF